MTLTPFGFRVAGDLTGPRRLVDWHAAFGAHCRADPRAEPDRESYVSLFVFPGDFYTHLERTGSTWGYCGPAALPYLTFDLDREHLDDALADAKNLAAGLLDAYWRLDDGHLFAFFSGRKGFHLLVPMPTGIDPTAAVLVIMLSWPMSSYGRTPRINWMTCRLASRIECTSCSRAWKRGRPSAA
jgi:hypothetical protein